MDTGDNLKEELRSLGLDRIARDKPSPPEGYFDQLPDRVMNRWQHTESKRLPLRRMFAVAAIMTGIALGVTLLTTSESLYPKSQDITATEAYEYIMEHVEEFSPLILQQAEMTTEPSDPLQEARDIEEYLLEELEDHELETIF